MKVGVMMIEWKDASKDAAGSPRILKTKVGHIDVMVRQYVGLGEEWYLTIKEFEIQRYNIGICKEEAAKARAMLLLQATVQHQIKLLQEIEEVLYTSDCY